MLIHEKKPFIRGSLMLVSFAVLFCILLTPVMRDEQGHHLTGLQYADSVFNELSKGSSYFIPEVMDIIKKVEGRDVTITVAMKKAELAPLAVGLLQKAGAVEAMADGNKVRFKGDLGRILTAATDVGDKLYKNDAGSVAQLNSLAPQNGASADRDLALQVASTWWYLLSPSIKELQKQQMIGEAQVVDRVLRRAVEPGNNYFGVPAVKVSEHLPLMTAMLAFYILYTLWYGFSIFELFEGIGLAMTKSKVKQEH